MMKRMLILLLALMTAATLAGCGSSGIYVHDAVETPASVLETEAPSPAHESETPTPPEAGPSVSPVVLSVSLHQEDYPAPDDSGKTILSYGYDMAKVYLADDPSAAEQINRILAREDERFYSGSGNGDGLNVMLEQAMDNYAYALSVEDKTVNTAFSCMRSVNVERGDSRVLSLRYRVNSYTGGQHGLYYDRAYVFDVDSGSLLSLDDLSTDRGALEELLMQTMSDALANDVRYQVLPGYIEKFLEGSVEEALRALIREGSWYLNEEGLVLFSDLYELGSYADGIVRFTVPYAELGDLLKEEWLPEQRTAGGELSISALKAGESGQTQLLDKITLSADGEEYCLRAEGTVYDLSVISVRYFSDSVGFYQTETHWYGSCLADSGVQLRLRIPSGMPELMIRWHDAEGLLHSALVAKDASGTAILLDEELAAAVG